MDFHRCIDFILIEEGGLSNHPKDPGRLTKFGISQRSYPQLDIRRLTVDDAKAIYRRDFWNRIQGDALPVGLDLVVLDMAVNAGVRRAVRLLQQLAGVPDDGIIGPITLAAVRQRPPADLIESYSRLRMIHYRSCKGWPTFGNGWTARVQRSRQMALALDHALEQNRMNWRTLAREPSTWRGLIWLLTAAGIALSPEQQTAVIAVGMAGAGLIGAFFPDTTTP